MRGLVMAALAAIVTLGGCVQSPPQPPVAEPAIEAPPPAVVEAAPPAATAAPAAEPVPAAPPAEVAPPTAAAAPAVPVAAQTPSRPVAAAPAPPRETAPAARPSQPATAPSPVTTTAPAPQRAAAPVASAAPPVAVAAPSSAAPELDLVGLEQRLRETPAIGVFTKLSLKNQVDDLLDQFRGFYRGQLQVQLTDLRARYELLLLKVLTLLQDADQDLANAIAASREAIWGILTDPDKLAAI